jgi:hypothetical protein
MIRFGRIELATYTNKPLYSMDFNAKEALNLEFESNHENLKKNSKF